MVFEVCLPFPCFFFNALFVVAQFSAFGVSLVKNNKYVNTTTIFSDRQHLSASFSPLGLPAYSSIVFFPEKLEINYFMGI